MTGACGLLGARGSDELPKEAVWLLATSAIRPAGYCRPLDAVVPYCKRPQVGDAELVPGHRSSWADFARR